MRETVESISRSFVLAVVPKTISIHNQYIMNSIRLGACDQCSKIVSLPAGTEEIRLIRGRSNGATERSLAGGAIVSD